jgi:hypothetical protein
MSRGPRRFITRRQKGIPITRRLSDLINRHRQASTTPSQQRNCMHAVGRLGEHRRSGRLVVRDRLEFQKSIHFTFVSRGHLLCSGHCHRRPLSEKSRQRPSRRRSVVVTHARRGCARVAGAENPLAPNPRRPAGESRRGKRQLTNVRQPVLAAIYSVLLARSSGATYHCKVVRQTRHPC